MGDADSIAAATIIHNLQIDFFNSSTGKYNEFYVTLDVNDINELKEAIERVEKKTRAIEKILNKSETLYIKA